MSFPSSDLIIVGAGLFGLTVAHQAATRLGLKVLVLERRSHIGGNAHSETDTETGIEVHTYGSHIFHCNSEDIWRFINGFTAFTDYRHHVQTVHQGKVYPMPINLGTLCSFFGKVMSPDEARALVRKQAEKPAPATAANLEEKAISLVGRPLYEAFIRGYTAKQWQTDPRDLGADIITRLPVRFTFNARYFEDRYEGLPAEGYGALFRRMATHPNIDVRLGVDYFDIRDQLPSRAPLIYCGPIDRFFDHVLGPLGWRTLNFEKEIVPVRDYQGTAVMNYADEDIPYTRIHEFRHLHPERNYESEKTFICREYARLAASGDEPYYPINTKADKDRLDGYRAMARHQPRAIFGGRLGSYRYLDMHQAIGAALKLFETRLLPHFAQQRPLDPVDDF